jgi:UDP-glucose 4-epimerase
MILVTGGLGFIGSHTTRALLDLGESCVVAQRNVSQVPEDLQPELQRRLFVEAVDVEDAPTLLDIGRRHPITGIVQLADAAAISLWQQQWDGTSLNLGGIFDGLFHVLEAARAWGCGRVSIASSVGVYEAVESVPLREDEPLPMTSSHAIPVVKKCSEILAGFVGAQLGVEIVIFRPSAIWGPGGRDSSAFFAAPKLVHSAVRGVTADFSSSPAPLYADDGIDTCYVRDCGRAIALLQLAPALRHHTYNVGAGYAATNGEVADAVKRVIPDATDTLVQGQRPGATGEPTYLDITRLREDTGYAPAYDLEGSVADYVNWLRAGHAR